MIRVYSIGNIKIVFILLIIAIIIYKIVHIIDPVIWLSIDICDNFFGGLVFNWLVSNNTNLNKLCNLLYNFCDIFSQKSIVKANVRFFFYIFLVI